MRNFFIGDIAFAATLGFLTGILAASFAWPLLAVSAACVGTEIFATFLFRDKRFFYGSLFSLAALVLGAYYFYFFINWRFAAARFPSAESGSFRVVVSEEPVVSENYVSFSAALQPPFSGTVDVFVPVGGDVQYGDLLAVHGSLLPPRTAGGLPAVFPKSTETTSRGNGFWLTERLFDVKAAISKKFGEFLPRDSAALLGGMTLGGTTGMSVALKSEMAASETLYVTSMYGYKIAVIVAIVEALLAGFVPRRARFCIAACAIVLFVVMSGGNSSAVRGGIMMGLLMLAKETGSIFSKRNAIALTAAGMACFDPTVVAQAGFLFSFASVTGMAVLMRPLGRFLRLGEGRGMFGWKEAVLLSVASLVPVVPLVSAMFGSFSLTAIFANVLIAPVIPLGMAAGVALAATSFVSPWIAFFVSRAVSVILDYALWVVHFFAAHVVPLPFSFSGVMPFVLYYGAIGLFAYAYRDHGRS